MNILKFNTDHSEYAFQDVLNRLHRVMNNHDLRGMMTDLQTQYGLKNLAFLGYNLGKLSHNEPFSIVTYSQNWVSHYREKNYFAVDPVIKDARRSIIPLDWSTIDFGPRKIKRFFNEAFDAGVGRYGLSIPVQGRDRDYSIFSLTFDETGRDWYYFKNCYMRDFNILALYFHRAVLDVNNIRIPEFELSERQRDVLYWTACGKSNEETAMIMGISQSTIRYHVANILTQLNVVNMTHAVAKGVYYGLLRAPV